MEGTYSLSPAPARDERSHRLLYLTHVFILSSLSVTGAAPFLQLQVPLLLIAAPCMTIRSQFPSSPRRILLSQRAERQIQVVV